MIKVTIEVEGPDGRMEVTVEDGSSLTIPRDREEWKKRIAAAAATAVKKLHGAIDA